MGKLLFPDKYDWRGCSVVEFDPEKLSGRATVENTRMDADGVFENYLDGLTVEEIVESYGVKREAVQKILAFAEARGLHKAAVKDLIDWRGCEAVEFDPLKLGGRATVGDTRMDADGVLINFESGMTVEEIEASFGVERKAIETILAFGLPRRIKASA